MAIHGDSNELYDTTRSFDIHPVRIASSGYKKVINIVVLSDLVLDTCMVLSSSHSL